MPVTSVRWAASFRPHWAKWVKTRMRSPASNTASTISSSRASLPDLPAERPAVVLVGGGMVADLLERGDRGQDRPLALLPTHVRGVGYQPVEHRLVEADLLGRHRAVVELVDAVRQLGGHLRLGLGAPEHEDPVEGP